MDLNKIKLLSICEDLDILASSNETKCRVYIIKSDYKVAVLWVNIFYPMRMNGFANQIKNRLDVIKYVEFHHNNRERNNIVDFLIGMGGTMI